MKTCTKCKTNKDESLFYTQKSKKLSSWCKECINIQSVKWVSNNRERRKANLKSYDLRKKLSGTCRQCKLPVFKNSTLYCEKHWYNNIAYQNLKSRLIGHKLKEIAEKQQFICPYTKIILTPTINMSLDHRLCKSKNGSNDLDNIQWVHTEINYMKGDLTEQDFINFCKLVSKNF